MDSSQRNSPALEIISNAKVVFWDFDGVIKESVIAKGAAFSKLFAPYAADKSILDKIKDHHILHGGISRYKKIPLYMNWCQLDESTVSAENLACQYSQIVVDIVVASRWKPGVQHYLETNYLQNSFYLISATPLFELELIAERLRIRKYFKGVYGAPQEKTSAINDVLSKVDSSREECVFIGDSKSDSIAASLCKVPFIYVASSSCCNDATMIASLEDFLL